MYLQNRYTYASFYAFSLGAKSTMSTFCLSLLGLFLHVSLGQHISLLLHFTDNLLKDLLHYYFCFFTSQLFPQSNSACFVESIIPLKLLMPTLPTISLVIKPTESFQSSDYKAFFKNVWQSSCLLNAFLGFHNTCLFWYSSHHCSKWLSGNSVNSLSSGMPVLEFSWVPASLISVLYNAQRRTPFSSTPSRTSTNLYLRVKLYSIPYSPQCHSTFSNLSTLSSSLLLHCHINIPFTQATQVRNLGMRFNYFSPLLPPVHQLPDRAFSNCSQLCHPLLNCPSWSTLP